MTTKTCFLVFALCALIPVVGNAETTWRFAPLGVECTFPSHWILEEAPVNGDLAKGGVLIRADRTPGLPAGVRFELSLEPLSIKRSAQSDAIDLLLTNLGQTPKLQLLDSSKTTISKDISEVRVKWKIAQSRNTLESIYRILDVKDRRIIASISGRVELVDGVRDELNQLWDSIRAD